MTQGEAPLANNSKKVAGLVFWAAFISFIVDMYDVLLPTVILAPAWIYFQPKTIPAVISTTIFYLTFAITYIGRPLGAVIFGHYSDKIGRRKVTIISVIGFGIVTFIMGIMPGYATFGIAAVYIFLALRLINGVFLGGEYTAANPLAMEYAPKEKRGLYSGAIISGYPVAYVLLSLLAMLIFIIAPTGDENSSYSQWGWRIPFFLGMLISFAFAIWFIKKIPESELWKKSTKSKTPLKELFSGESLSNFIKVFTLMSGLWFGTAATLFTLPGMLITYLKIDSKIVTTELLIVSFLNIFAYAGGGILSQYWGRRRVFMATGLILFFVDPILYYLVVANAFNYTIDTVYMVLLEFLTLACWGVVTAYINEMFRTSVRASGYGVGYSVSMIIPVLYSFYYIWLSHLMPYVYTPIVLMVLGGILTVIGAVISPETKDIDFT